MRRPCVWRWKFVAWNGDDFKCFRFLTRKIRSEFRPIKKFAKFRLASPHTKAKFSEILNPNENFHNQRENWANLNNGPFIDPLSAFRRFVFKTFSDFQNHRPDLLSGSQSKFEKSNKIDPNLIRKLIRTQFLKHFEVFPMFLNF